MVEERLVSIEPGPPIQCSISLKDDPKEIILFESFPDNIKESHSAGWRTTSGLAPVSRNVTYSGGDYGGLSLDLIFVATLHPKTMPLTNWDQDYIDEYINQELLELERKVRWLEALTFPRDPLNKGIHNSSSGIPPRVLVTFGEFLTIEGVVRDFGVTWSKFHPSSVRPFVAEVNLSIQRVFNEYPTWYTVARRQGIRAPGLSMSIPAIEMIPLPGDEIIDAADEEARRADEILRLAALELEE